VIISWDSHQILKKRVPQSHLEQAEGGGGQVSWCDESASFLMVTHPLQSREKPSNAQT
jgi:hypothetical protein